MIWIVLVFALINVALAYQDSRRLANKKKIKHGINGIVYIALLAAVWFFHRKFDWELVKIIATLLLTRQIFFDIPLSLFRDLKWNYITPAEKPAAIIDRLEKRVFGMRGTLMYIVYVVALITLIVI